MKFCLELYIEARLNLNNNDYVIAGLDIGNFSIYFINFEKILNDTPAHINPYFTISNNNSFCFFSLLGLNFEWSKP